MLTIINLYFILLMNLRKSEVGSSSCVQGHASPSDTLGRTRVVADYHSPASLLSWMMINSGKEFNASLSI